MGDALPPDGRPTEAVGFYRAVLARCPDNLLGPLQSLAWPCLNSAQIEEALTSSQRRTAVELSHHEYFPHELVQSLALVGYWKEAKVENCQKAMEADPTSLLRRRPLSRNSTAERADR